MSIYEYLGESMLNSLENNNDFIELHSFGKGFWFGLKYRGEYEGLMAQPRRGQVRVERNKEGLFDVFICTGERYLLRNGYKPITHYNVFLDLLENSSIDNCYRVWRGEFPCDITENIEEQQALSSLALLMFEQELNWGNECWQRKSNFPPHVGTTYSRPRDMIMGFVKIIFTYGNIEAIPEEFWIVRLRDRQRIKTTPTFGQGGYRSFPNEYKIFFDELSNDNTAMPLMIGDVLNEFRNYANNAPDNPYYSEG